MIAPPALITVIKYGFLGLVVGGAGFLIASTVVIRKYKSEELEELVYKAHSSAVNGTSGLAKNSWKCLTQPSRSFCLMSSKKRLQFLNKKYLSPVLNKLEYKEISINEPAPSPIFLFIQRFKNLMMGFDVKPILLEPSILFCMLPPLQQYELISKGFNTHVLQGSSNVVTFGIFEKEAFILNQKITLQRALGADYELSRAQKWFEISPSGADTGDFYPTHFFFSKDNMTAHVVVFYQRQQFLWYPGLSEVDLLLQEDKKLFGNNCVFENFTSVPFYLNNNDDAESTFYFPSQTNQFLYQIQSSEYEECLSKSSSNENGINQLHPTLTTGQLNQRAEIAIHELKQKLRPKMTKFWLWKETLESWQNMCELFNKSAVFSVAVSAIAVAKINFTQSFPEDGYITLLENHIWENIQHKIVLDCFGLRIDIYPTYEDSSSIWYYEGNFTSTLKKITFTKFTLCSTDVFGQLMHKPCGRTINREINNL